MSISAAEYSFPAPSNTPKQQLFATTDAPEVSLAVKAASQHPAQVLLLISLTP